MYHSEGHFMAEVFTQWVYELNEDSMVTSSLAKCWVHNSLEVSMQLQVQYKMHNTRQYLASHNNVSTGKL